MKTIITILLLTIIWGCTPNNLNDDVVTEEITIVNDVTHNCVHKYDSSRNFSYDGRVSSFTKEVFGKTTWVYVYYLADSTEKLLSKNELANYTCEKITK
jgi:hypothetical protein